MKKTELVTLGLTKEQIRAVQKLNGRDVLNMKDKGDPVGNQKIREAIVAMLPMLKRRATLKRLLTDVNYLYHVENREQEEPPATEIAPLDEDDNSNEETEMKE